jgi:NIMA (never in mitosis gene a)-related kinase
MTMLQPPFKAKDMKSLYKKVLVGQYPKIHSFYSLDLHNVIKCLLQVSPNARPTSSNILEMDEITRRMKNNKKLLHIDTIDTIPELLQTIKIPNNIKLLTSRLPKAKYNNIKTIPNRIMHS